MLDRVAEVTRCKQMCSEIFSLFFLYNPSHETIADWVTPNLLAIL